MIECVHAAKWYGQIIAVNDVSLRVGPGVTGLLGPNGAGKSTLLKMMVGQLRPSKGAVNVLGQPIWGNRAVLAKVGYCPEHEGTYEDLTGLEMVTAMTELHGFSRADARARAAKLLGTMELTGDMHRRLGHARVADAVERGDVPAQLAGAEPAGHGLVLGHQREVVVD